MEVLPAIIEDTYDEVEKKFKMVSSIVDWVQVDICDGEFVGRRTWTQIEDLVSAPPSLNIDLHIMVRDPRLCVAHAMNVRAIRRITFHYEATVEVDGVIQEILQNGKEAAIALNPATPVETIKFFTSHLHAILVMGVNPGWGGQGFLPETPGRIRALKDMTKGMKARIGVDGGIHLVSGSAQACVDAGAEFLVVGSDIFSAQNPREIVEKLQRLSPRTD